MREFVAVAHPMFAFNASALKQQASFRRVAIPTLSDVVSATHQDTKDTRSTLEVADRIGIDDDDARGVIGFDKVKELYPDITNLLQKTREQNLRLSFRFLPGARLLSRDERSCRESMRSGL